MGLTVHHVEVVRKGARVQLRGLSTRFATDTLVSSSAPPPYPIPPSFHHLPPFSPTLFANPRFCNPQGWFRTFEHPETLRSLSFHLHRI